MWNERRLWIQWRWNVLHLELIWGTRNIPQAALLKLMILYTWNACLRESLEVPKGSQATCSVWCGSRCGNGANAREIGLISIWFWVHRSILHSSGDISVLLVLWQFCRGLSGVQSSKSRLLTCFYWEKAIALDTMQRNRASSRSEEWLMGFLELRQERGVYSRVMVGMSIRNWSLFSEVRTPV